MICYKNNAANDSRQGKTDLALKDLAAIKEAIFLRGKSDQKNLFGLSICQGTFEIAQRI